MTNEKNRRIATWLEPFESLPAVGSKPEGRLSPNGGWIIELRKWKARDFIHSESASAMVLEAMAKGCVDSGSEPRLYFSSTFDGKGWGFGQTAQAPSDSPDEWVWWVKDHDRKTAIAEACLAYIEAGGKPNG